jgi:transposase-like protein
MLDAALEEERIEQMRLACETLERLQMAAWRSPWRCPACRSAIEHSSLDAEPRWGARYRCHVCRLELTLNEATGKLDVAPFDARMT